MNGPLNVRTPAPGIHQIVKQAAQARPVLPFWRKPGEPSSMSSSTTLNASEIIATEKA
jgi:hypothetical protein